MRDDEPLSGRRDDRSERSGLEFFGTVSASVTHELNNVLSVIDQVCGLFGDAVAAAESGRTIAAERIKVAQERLQRQVRKGVEIVNRFNRFSHSVDAAHREFDVGDETANLVSLSRRFAELKKIRLEAATIESGIGVAGDAFFFQETVFLGLQTFIEHSGEGDSIEVGVRRDGDAALVTIEGTGRDVMDAGDSRLARLAEAMVRMGGSALVGETGQGGTSVQLRLPAAADDTARS